MGLFQVVFLVLSILTHLGSCENRYIIDEDSCLRPFEADKLDIFTPVQNAVEQAKVWAREAANELRKPRGEWNPRIAEKVEWILGSSDEKIAEIAGHFAGIARLIYSRFDVYSDRWQTSHDAKDVVIVCNLDYLSKEPSTEFPDLPWRNRIHGGRLAEDELGPFLKMGNKDRGLVAFVEGLGSSQLPEGHRIPSLIVLVPEYIEKLIKKDWQPFDDDKVRQVGNPRLLKALETKGMAFGADLINKLFKSGHGPHTIVDFLESLPLTMIHELTHTRIGGETRDMADGSYGWSNVVTLRNPDNADNRAFLAMCIQLILHHGYDVTKEGKLVAF